MTTNEGQQALMNLRDAYDRMDLLKKFLISRISAAPFRGGVGTELGGDAVSADLNGIRIALGSHGEMVKPWEEVSPRLVLQLANYYLADTAAAEKERAEVALATALYCYESGGFKLAQTYIDQALKLDPGAEGQDPQVDAGYRARLNRFFDRLFLRGRNQNLVNSIRCCHVSFMPHLLALLSTCHSESIVKGHISNA